MVDPPTTGKALQENMPSLVTGAFIEIFQEGKGDFNSMKKKVDLQAWVRHVLMWPDGRALACKRFRYLALNTLQRKQTRGCNKAFWKQCPGEANLDIDLLSREKVRKLAARVVGQTSHIAGSVGEKLQQRGNLEAMVQQQKVGDRLGRRQRWLGGDTRVFSHVDHRRVPVGRSESRDPCIRQTRRPLAGADRVAAVAVVGGAGIVG